jgi:hypothetical protein
MPMLAYSQSCRRQNRQKTPATLVLIVAGHTAFNGSHFGASLSGSETPVVIAHTCRQSIGSCLSEGLRECDTVARLW